MQFGSGTSRVVPPDCTICSNCSVILTLCTAAWVRTQGCTSQSLPDAEQGGSLQAVVTEGVLVLAL